jgi:signal transduction histidine kinase
MKKEYLQRLNAFANRLLAEHSFEELNKIVVEEAMALSEAEYGCLIYKNKDNIKSAYTSSSFLPKMIKRGALEKAFHKNSVVSFPKSNLRDDASELKNSGIKNISAIPLIYKDRSLGLIMLFSTKEEFLTQNTLDLFSIFGPLATLGLKEAMGQKDLKRGLDLRDRFISIASHELRTPLTSINGYIQLLRRKITDQSLSETRWIESLYTESTRLTTLMKELLDINRINQGKFAFVFGEVSMKDVVEKAVERARLTNPEHPIIFDNKIKDRQHTVIGDFDKLVEMVSGILSNAIKFSPPNSDINVTLNSNPRTIYVTVRDTGKGMSAQDLAAIFEGFYKSDVAHIEGMGVGLFLAKHIVAHHRGKIKVDSKINKGTTVEVTLPQAKS